MEPRGSRLAGRLKEAQTGGAEAAQPDPAEPPPQSGEEARADLFAALEGFAGELGLPSRKDEDSLVIVQKEREVRLHATDNPNRLRVVLDQLGYVREHELARDRALSWRWVLHFKKHGRVERMPLFDQGLEELMVEGLGLPRPKSDDRPMALRTARAILGLDRTSDTPARAAPPPGAPRPAAPPSGGEGSPDAPKDGPRKRRL